MQYKQNFYVWLLGNKNNMNDITVTFSSPGHVSSMAIKAVNEISWKDARLQNQGLQHPLYHTFSWHCCKIILFKSL